MASGAETPVVTCPVCGRRVSGIGVRVGGVAPSRAFPHRVRCGFNLLVPCGCQVDRIWVTAFARAAERKTRGQPAVPVSDLYSEQRQRVESGLVRRLRRLIVMNHGLALLGIEARLQWAGEQIIDALLDADFLGLDRAFLPRRIVLYGRFDGMIRQLPGTIKTTLIVSDVSPKVSPAMVRMSVGMEPELAHLSPSILMNWANQAIHRVGQAIADGHRVPDIVYRVFARINPFFARNLKPENGMVCLPDSPGTARRSARTGKRRISVTSLDRDAAESDQL